MTEPYDDGYTLDDARADNPKWFEADDFFGTRIVRQYPLGGAVYVVHTAQPPHGDVTWNITRMHEAGTDGLGPMPNVGLGSEEGACRVAETLAAAEHDHRLLERANRERFVDCDKCLEQQREHPGWATWQYRPPNAAVVLELCSECLPVVTVQFEGGDSFQVIPANARMIALGVLANLIHDEDGNEAAVRILNGLLNDYLAIRQED